MLKLDLFSTSYPLLSSSASTLVRMRDSTGRYMAIGKPLAPWNWTDLKISFLEADIAFKCYESESE